MPRGAGRAMAPGASLGGAPPQLVGPNCKKKIRPRQLSKVTSLQSAVADAKRGRGRTPNPEGTSHVGLCGGRGMLIFLGGAPMQALAPGRWRPSVRHCYIVLYSSEGKADPELFSCEEILHIIFRIYVSVWGHNRKIT